MHSDQEGGARLIFVSPLVSREGRVRLAGRACFWGGHMVSFLLCFSVDDRCLTQLGGCAIVDAGGKVLFDFADNGICDVCCFEKLLRTL